MNTSHNSYNSSRQSSTASVKGTLLTVMVSLPMLLPLSGCHNIEEWDNNPEGNFQALWTIVDEHYCFFQEKDIDWNEVRTRYAQRISNDMNSTQLFDACADMLDELQDGHVNLSSWFNTSYYSNWWSDYPQNFDERLVEQYYLNFDYRSMGSSKYAILNENIGYIRYPGFDSSIGEGNIDGILSYFSLCTGLIFDIRDNGGGALSNSEKWAKRFTTERVLAGYMINKTGPGHNDVSEPFEYYFDPVTEDHLVWTKPVVVLTNRSTYSAANNFVSVVQYFPNVKIVGARTGGGSGIPITMEIPCGWSVRMSSVSVLDAKKQTTEFGIDPSPGCEVDLDPELALQGVDTMIERAIEVLNSNW